MKLPKPFSWSREEARSAKFDGKFIIGVRTTGIYCLPSCPTHPPKRENVTLYRTEAEVAEWRLRDPIARLSRQLSAEGALAEEGARAVEKELNAELDRALEHVESQPPPPRASLFDDVYAELPAHLLEQRRELFAPR